MNCERIKNYLQTYQGELDECLEAYYDFVIQGDKLYCHMVDSAEPENSAEHHFGIYFIIVPNGYFYKVLTKHHKNKSTNVSKVYRSRREIAELLEGEI